jgi:hypothetical protein
VATYSGIFDNNGYTLYLDVTESDVSIANNTSVVNWKLRIVSTKALHYGSWDLDGTPYSVSIDGAVVASGSKAYDFRKYQNLEVASGKKEITHDTNGSASVDFYASFGEVAPETPIGDAVARGTFALSNIPRYLSITSLEITNKTESSVVVKWSVSDPRSSTYYSFDNGATWIGSSTDGESVASDGKSGTFNIVNLIANTTYNMKVKIKRTDSGLWTESGVVTFTTYNYPHCTSSPDFTIGDALTLDLYNPLGRSVRVSGYAKTDGREIFNGTTSGTRMVGFNDSHSVGEQYASIPNSQDGQYTVVVVYNDTPMMREAGNVYKIRGNEVPTINAFDYEENNDSVYEITRNKKNIVQNKSDLLAIFGSATPNYRAGSIVRYVIECNGFSRTETREGSYPLGTVDSERDVDLTLTAVDSRGLSASKTIKVTILAHSDPTAVVTLQRLNNYEDETYLTVDGSVSSVNSKNTMAIKYRYKVSGGSYGGFTTIGDRAKQTLRLDKNNVYVFNVVVTDAFGSKYDKEHTLGKGVFPLFIDTNKNSVGVNKFPVYDHSFEASGLIALGEANSFELEVGESRDIYIFLAGVTALVNFRMAGANLEIAKLFYVFRPTQYFGIHKTIFDESFNNTGAVVPFEVGNAVNGYKFTMTNNHSSPVIVRYGILELC